MGQISMLLTFPGPLPSNLTLRPSALLRAADSYLEVRLIDIFFNNTFSVPTFALFHIFRHPELYDFFHKFIGNRLIQGELNRALPLLVT